MNQDYIALAHQLNLNPLRVPRHEGEFIESFIEYLKLLYNSEEVALVKHLLPLPQFTSTEDLSKKIGLEIEIVKKTLDALHEKNHLVGMGNMFALPPMPFLVNIHQFYSEKKPDDIKAAELYIDFFVDKKYSRYYETSEKGTPVFRTIPIGKTILAGEKILSYEEAEQYIMSMEHDNFCLIPCPCRTRTEKLGIRECKDRFDIGFCLTLGFAAIHFQLINMGQKITKEEAVTYTKNMIEKGHICCTDNAMTKNSIICFCCECCCSQIRGRTRWGNVNAVAPSNFIPQSNEDCIACGKCQKRCQLGAISVNKETKKVNVDIEKCVGCGVCVVTCPTGALKLTRQRDIKPFVSSSQLLKAINIENMK